jgi:hypothetical protein
MRERIRTIFLDASSESLDLREDLNMDASFGDFLEFYGGQSQPAESFAIDDFATSADPDSDHDI